MSSSGSEAVKCYVAMRSQVERFTSFWLVVALILLGLAKSPSFELKDFFGLVEGGIHNGYVAAYGCLAIGLIVFGIHLRLRETLGFRDRVLIDLSVAIAEKATSTHGTATEYLLRLPYSLPTEKSARGWIASVQLYSSIIVSIVPVFLAAIAYGVFFYFYLGFHHHESPETWFQDLYWGHGDWGGFKADWSLMRMGGEKVFLNAPYQTWLFSSGLIYAALVLLWWCWVVIRPDGPYRTQFFRGWLQAKVTEHPQSASPGELS